MTSMFFQRGLHYLSLFVYFPNSNFAFGSARDDPGTIRSRSDSSAAVIMGIIYDVQQFTGLR